MRRRINQKLKDYCSNNSNLTIDELLPLVNKKFKEKYTRLSLQKYLIRNKIPYKYKNENKSHNMSKLPIGTEYVKGDGMILVKIARNKWEYKQRLIYMQHYGVELTEEDYIIFLDNDRTNFDINNLQLVSRRVSAILSNQQLKSSNADVTKLGIDTAKLIIKIKEKKNGERKIIRKQKEIF